MTALLKPVFLRCVARLSMPDRAWPRVPSDAHPLLGDIGRLVIGPKRQALDGFGLLSVLKPSSRIAGREAPAIENP